MALITCPECGKQISNQASTCPTCGFPIQKMIQEEEERKLKEQQRQLKEQAEQAKKEKAIETKQKREVNLKKIKPIHIVLVIIVVAIAVFLFIHLSYTNAVNAYNSGDYAKAYGYFERSNYKDSEVYRENALIGYITVLIQEKDFETADEMMKLITEKNNYAEMQKEINYVRGLEAYEKGIFELAYDLFADLKDYKDANDYITNSKLMKLIQGEWNLPGTLVSFYNSNKDINFAALKINGWDATLLYCTDLKSTYEVAGSCKLVIGNTGEANLKIGTTEYIITSQKGGKYLVAEMINDKFLDSFEREYVWERYGEREELCFSKVEDGIPKKPEIGMTAEQVRKGSWGEPEDINKSTYAWGVHEQWCYSGNRYVYLENGIVTSISE